MIKYMINETKIIREMRSGSDNEEEINFLMNKILQK